MKKRVLSALLTLALILALAPAAVIGAQAYIEPDLTSAANIPGGLIELATSGDYPWEVVSTVTGDYVKSGNGGVPDSVSSMYAWISPNETAQLRFKYMARGEGTEDKIYDACEFYVDDTLMLKEGAGLDDWLDFSCILSSGRHKLEWKYTKDGSVSPDGDFFAIDDLTLAYGADIGYDLYIRGEQVTGASLEGNGYIFDPDTNTLTLTGDITAENNAAIQSGIVGLTINAAPERSSCGIVSNGEFPALLLLEDTTITGSADNIYISCTTAEPAIYVGNNADLTFFDANVTVNSFDGDYAIYAYDNLARLNVVKSHVAADSCVSAVYGFYQRVFLTASTLMNPAGGIIGEWEIFDAWGNRAKSVCFEPAETKLAGICYDDYSGSGYAEHMISFYPTDVSSVTPGRACPEGASLESGVYVDGCYYAYSYDADECVSSFFKLPNGAAKWQEIPEVVPFQIISMSYDPCTESVYGIAAIIEEAGDRALVKIDLATGGVETVKYYGFSIDSRLQAIAFGERGVCYGVDHNGDVYIIDVVNGDCFFSFSTDVICGNAGDLVYDFENKALYWTQSSGAEDNGLYIIDLITEKARLIGRIGGGMEIVGLYVAPAEQQYLKGDLDRDGEITVGDALIALRIAARLDVADMEDILIGDVDGDDEITVGDALKILRVAARLDDQSALG